ncbi:hypothetical protein ABZ348_07385 [Streptomyces sp. NPDC005963]|uniref:hypothetical protein n=1 Tax=Streptomyces sp. NPDC005963 TaxID=3156721 RepID=UPI0033E21B89
MDGYQDLTALIESAWRELHTSDVGRRDLCLDVVSDVLETGRLTPADAEQAVERLVMVALSDESFPVRESALHAACTASTHYELPYRVVEPLGVSVDVFEPLLLDYVLAILGATHDHEALLVAERFLQHPHPEVRRAAAEAVTECVGSGSPPRKRRSSSSGT